jgi:hypothetical protein
MTTIQATDSPARADPAPVATGGFFAVDQSTWSKVCGLGLNAAVSYLVLARGTGKDHQHTAWSADAIERRTGISWRRAKVALDLIQRHQLMEPVRGGTRPMYRLTIGDSPIWIWLPNEIVDGLEAATSPLERIRQIGDPMTLRLFVDLYGAHGLRDDGGVSRSVTYQAFTRHTVGEFAEYTVYGFAQGSTFVVWDGPVTEPHKRHNLTNAERKAGITQGTDFFHRLGALQALRLFEWVPTLWEHDGPDAEPIHPVHLASLIPIESALAEAADAAGRVLVMESQLRRAEDEDCTFFVPVLRHLVNATVIGIARMKYRPRTRSTSMWFAGLHGEGSVHVEQYEALTERAVNMSAWRAG